MGLILNQAFLHVLVDPFLVLPLQSLPLKVRITVVNFLLPFAASLLRYARGLRFTGSLRKYLWKFRYRLVVVLWVQMCMYISRDCLLSSLARNHSLQCTAENNAGVLPKFLWVFT